MTNFYSFRRHRDSIKQWYPASNHSSVSNSWVSTLHA